MICMTPFFPMLHHHPGCAMLLSWIQGFCFVKFRVPFYYLNIYEVHFDGYLRQARTENVRQWDKIKYLKGPLFYTNKLKMYTHKLPCHPIKREMCAIGKNL